MKFKVPVLPGEYVYAIPDFDMIEKRIIVEGVVEKNFVVGLSEYPIVIFCVKGFNVVSERCYTSKDEAKTALKSYKNGDPFLPNKDFSKTIEIPDPQFDGKTIEWDFNGKRRSTKLKVWSYDAAYTTGDMKMEVAIYGFFYAVKERGSLYLSVVPEGFPELKNDGLVKLSVGNNKVSVASDEESGKMIWPIIEESLDSSGKLQYSVRGYGTIRGIATIQDCGIHAGDTLRFKVNSRDVNAVVERVHYESASEKFPAVVGFRMRCVETGETISVMEMLNATVKSDSSLVNMNLF